MPPMACRTGRAAQPRTERHCHHPSRNRTGESPNLTRGVQAANDPFSMSVLFSPLRLRDITFKNRVFVSRMCQYSSEDGLPTDWHLVHLGRRRGGAGDGGGDNAVGGEGEAADGGGRVATQSRFFAGGSRRRVASSDMACWNDVSIF